MAGPSISYDIGYYGVVKLDGTQVLATGGNVSVQHTPLYSSGVWGAGWYNATEKVAYAPSYVTLSSSVNYQLTNGVVKKLQEWAFDKRNESKTVTILPNGVAGYTGDAYCTGCSFSCSQDAIVSGDISLKSGDIKSKITTNSNSSVKTGTGQLNECSDDYLSVFPFWASSVLLQTTTGHDRSSPQSGGSTVEDALDWNASYTSDLVFVMTCCGKEDDGDQNGVIEAKYCCLGTMQASGSFTLFKINDHLKAQNIRKCRKVSMKMKDVKGDNQYQIKFGKVLLQSGSTDVQNGTSLVQSSFNFTALGNDSQPPMKFDEV